MNYLNYYKNFFKKIFIVSETNWEAEDKIKPLLKILNNIPVIAIHNKSEIPAEESNQHSLFINLNKECPLDSCPGSKGHLCCNYLTINLYEGCTIGCTYCIMKSYLNFAPITVNMNIEPTIIKAIRYAKANPNKLLRIGTGETGDSLLFDPLFNISKEFIQAFSPINNIIFELKTKTNYIDHLLNIPKKGKVVIGFSMNPQKIIDNEEGIASTLSERIEAAKRVIKHDYLVSFHFDPILSYDNWEQDYLNVIDAMREIPASQIAWISMGTFRYPGQLKDKIDQRWFLYSEYVCCKDKKYRYPQKIRSEMYEILLKKLNTVFFNVPIYLCMESSTIWNKVFNKNPKKIYALCTIFNDVYFKKQGVNNES